MADIHLEPDRILETGTRTTGCRLRLGPAIEHLLGSGHFGAVRLHQHRRDFFRRFFRHQSFGQRHIVFIDLDRL